VTVSATTTHASWSSEGPFPAGAYQTTDQGAACFDGSGHPKLTTPSGPTACEVDALNVGVPSTYWSTHNGGVELKLFDNATDDFDFYVYRCVGTCTSASNGTRGALVASATNSNGNGSPVNSLPEEDASLIRPPALTR
jgi:hypothetical protein